MKVLVACEFTQTVTKAFRERGHEAFSCDIIPSEGNPDWHIQDDVRNHLDKGWDLMIAHPPCQYLANSGARWMVSDPTRRDRLLEAVQFFITLKRARIERIAVENPIPIGIAKALMGKYDQIIQPYQFGEEESKATCLWLKNLPPLWAKYSGSQVIRQTCWVKLRKSSDRSRTFSGIARAMAEQWG